MSDTPRTDAAAIFVWHGVADEQPLQVVDVNVARTLERELAERTRERNEFQRMAGANGLAGLEMGREIESLCAEVARLRLVLMKISAGDGADQYDLMRMAYEALTPAEDAVLNQAKRRSHTLVATPVAVEPAEVKHDD
jgi:hypothetical protein